MEQDHCTAWFEGSWAHCCAAHDIAYGDLAVSRLDADAELARCVAELGPVFAGVAVAMYLGVRAFGWLFRRGKR